MASGAAEMANPLLAFRLQIRIIHEGGVGVGRRRLLFQGDQIAGNVLGILGREAQAGHDGHVLDFEFVAVIRALAVLQVKNVGQALLFVIFRTDVFLFERAVRTSAFARIVDPTHEVVVVILLTDTSEIRGKGAALDLIAFANGMAGEAAARFEQFFSVGGVAGIALGQRISQRRLPDEGGDGLDLVVVETEIRHFSGSAEITGLLEPNGNPIFI